MMDLFPEEENAFTRDCKKSKRRVKSERRTLYDYFNLDLFGSFLTAGKEQMPILLPVERNIELPNNMMCFDEAYTKNVTDCIIHFYTDDRRFLRIIRNPKKYLPFLKRCAAVIEPDLSQYANMPYALRLAHAWLNRSIAAWLQSNGVRIIQNITWSLKDSYEYSLAGRAKNTIVAVNSTGVVGHEYSEYLWNKGYENVVLPLQPVKILRYGDRMPNDRAEISVYFENTNLIRMRNGR